MECHKGFEHCLSTSPWQVQKLLGEDDDDDHVTPHSAVQGLDAAALATGEILQNHPVN